MYCIPYIQYTSNSWVVSYVYILYCQVPTLSTAYTECTLFLMWSGFWAYKTHKNICFHPHPVDISVSVELYIPMLCILYMLGCWHFWHNEEIFITKKRKMAHTHTHQNGSDVPHVWHGNSIEAKRMNVRFFVLFYFCCLFDLINMMNSSHTMFSDYQWLGMKNNRKKKKIIWYDNDDNNTVCTMYDVYT